MNIAIIYSSGTGNTEAMADLISKGAGEAGATVLLKNASAAATGYPSMGDEVLEESEFKPFVESILGSVSGKKMGYSAPMAGATASGCAIGPTV